MPLEESIWVMAVAASWLLMVSDRVGSVDEGDWAKTLPDISSARQMAAA